MNRFKLFPYVLIGVLLLGWTNLSQTVSDRMRSWVVEKSFFAWRCANGVRSYLSDRPLFRKKQEPQSEWMQLKLENQNLKEQIQQAKQWIFHEKRLQVLSDLVHVPQLDRRREHLFDRLRREADFISARVIYRDSSSWSSSLWVHVGEADNRAIGERIITKNSPVVDGSSVIGVVDYVGEKQSRIRLITDSALTLAVRAVRGESQHKEIVYLLDAAKELFSCLDGGEEAAVQLDGLKKKLRLQQREFYLAKGEVHGCGAPFWQVTNSVLMGTGFNYDYADAEGPARELRTGAPLNRSGVAMPLIQKGDHLVTSGLDGVFPPGLSVALVTFVAPLKEGSFAYAIEAKPTARALSDLQEVFILPSLSGEL